MRTFFYEFMFSVDISNLSAALLIWNENLFIWRTKSKQTFHFSSRIHLNCSPVLQEPFRPQFFDSLGRSTMHWEHSRGAKIPLGTLNSSRWTVGLWISETQFLDSFGRSITHWEHCRGTKITLGTLNSSRWTVRLWISETKNWTIGVWITVS